MSCVLIIDEWLYHDLVCENGKEKMLEAYKLIREIVNKCDKILIVHNSPFSKKIFNQLSKMTKDVIGREIFKFIRNNILLNSNKNKLYKGSLSQELRGELRKIFEQTDQDDHYFLEAYFDLTMREGIDCCRIITTDNRLIEAIRSGNYDVEIIHRDEFIREYMQSNP